LNFEFPKRALIRVACGGACHFWHCRTLGFSRRWALPGRQCHRWQLPGSAPWYAPRAVAVPGSHDDVVLNIIVACLASAREARTDTSRLRRSGPETLNVGTFLRW